MAFFDEIGKKITQTGQGMVQKTKDTAETMRLNSAITDEEKRIQELYLAIGQRYFELHPDSYEPEMEELVLSIKEANTKIENYAEQIKRLKGIIHCPNCNGEVAYGAPFCSHCGTKMPEIEAAPVESKVRRCKQCGLPLPEGAGFCTNCGTKAESPAPVVAPVAVPVAPAAPVAEPAPVAPVVPAVPVAAPAVPVAPAAPVAPETPVAPAIPAAHVCANCGCALLEGSLFCTNCGTKVSN